MSSDNDLNFLSLIQVTKRYNQRMEEEQKMKSDISRLQFVLTASNNDILIEQNKMNKQREKIDESTKKKDNVVCIIAKHDSAIEKLEESLDQERKQKAMKEKQLLLLTNDVIINEQKLSHSQEELEERIKNMNSSLNEWK